MAQQKDWKIALIGGGGKIAGAILFNLLNRKRIAGGEIVLYGRSREHLSNNMDLAERICTAEKQNFKISICESLDEALEGASIVLYTATAGLEPCMGYKALGISQGAHIMHIGEKVKELCPEAWFLVDTNPPDIPLMAVNMKFGLKKLIGLCNAPVISRNLLTAFLKCREENLRLLDIGVNHEVWFYDILLDSISIYDGIRASLPAEYSHETIESDYLKSFPEWKTAFLNNIEILKLTGYLSSPVGGSKRFRDLPVSPVETAKLMKRPGRQDFADCMKPGTGKDEIIAVTGRCGGGIPLYIAGIIESLINSDNREHTVQVLNEDAFPDFSSDAMLQMSCNIGQNNIRRPHLAMLPDYIKGTLASRVQQNLLAARALAQQDESLMLQSMLMFPERVSPEEARRVLAEGKSVEPLIALN